MSTSDPDPTKPTIDPAAEGARARHQGKPRDARSYPLDSKEREEWMEGYDGRAQGAGPDFADGADVILPVGSAIGTAGHPP